MSKKNTKYLSCHHLDILEEIQGTLLFWGTGCLMDPFQNQLASWCLNQDAHQIGPWNPQASGWNQSTCLSCHHLVWIISPSCFCFKKLSAPALERLQWPVSSIVFQGSKISPKGQSGPKTSYRQSTYRGEQTSVTDFFQAFKPLVGAYFVAGKSCSPYIL